MDYILNSYCMLSITSIAFLKTYKSANSKRPLGSGNLEGKQTAFCQ